MRWGGGKLGLSAPVCLLSYLGRDGNGINFRCQLESMVTDTRLVNVGKVASPILHKFLVEYCT